MYGSEKYGICRPVCLKDVIVPDGIPISDGVSFPCLSFPVTFPTFVSKKCAESLAVTIICILSLSHTHTGAARQDTNFRLKLKELAEGNSRRFRCNIIPKPFIQHIPPLPPATERFVMPGGETRSTIPVPVCRRRALYPIHKIKKTIQWIN